LVKVGKKPRIKVERLPRPEAIGLAMMPDAMVAGIECHAPAANAGISTGDRIVEVDGKQIRTIDDFCRALHAARHKPAIKVVIDRFTTKWTVTINLPRGWASVATKGLCLR
jgi:S1-C subfamily serine protease